jgi:hypothetical protein
MTIIERHNRDYLVIYMKRQLVLRMGLGTNLRSSRDATRFGAIYPKGQ